MNPTLSTSSVLHAIASNWWVLLLRGMLLILLGTYAMLNPGLSLLTWALVVGCFQIADGSLAIVAGFLGWVESRGWVIVRGALSLLVGAFAIWHPALFGTIAGLTVIFTVAVSAIVGGVLEIIVAIRERKVIEGEGWMILGGVCSILFGIALILAPLLSLALFIQFSGMAAIFFGVMCIVLSFNLRSFAHRKTATKRS